MVTTQKVGYFRAFSLIVRKKNFWGWGGVKNNSLGSENNQSIK